MSPPRRNMQSKWSRIIQDWQTSGQTIRGYCLQHGIQQSGFYMWKKRLGLTQQRESGLKIGTKNKVEPTMKFLPVQIKESSIVETAGKHQRVDIFLPNGSVLRFAGEIAEDRLSLIMKMVASC